MADSEPGGWHRAITFNLIDCHLMIGRSNQKGVLGRGCHDCLLAVSNRLSSIKPSCMAKRARPVVPIRRAIRIVFAKRKPRIKGLILSSPVESSIHHLLWLKLGASCAVIDSCLIVFTSRLRQRCACRLQSGSRPALRRLFLAVGLGRVGHWQIACSAP